MEASKKARWAWLKSPCFAIVLAALGALVGFWANDHFYQKNLQSQIDDLKGQIAELNREKRDIEKDLDEEKRKNLVCEIKSNVPELLQNPKLTTEPSTEPALGQSKILFKVVPGPGAGPDALAPVEGRVEGIENPGRYKILLYTHTDRWYIQPFADQPLADIDSAGKWNSETHLGQQYAALVVLPKYSPQSAPEELPPLGDGVLAKVIVSANIK